MAFTIPTREQIFQAFIGDYQVAQPDKNTSRGSDPYRLGRTVSGTAWSILGKVKWVVDKLLPDSTVDWVQDRWAAIYNFPRKQPQGSTGTNVLRVTGTIGNAVPVNSQLAHADGTLYHVTSSGAVVGGSGYVDVSIAADSKGQATNKLAGETLTFSPAPSGIDADATLQLALAGGIDLETPTEFGPRLQQHIAEPQEGGSIADWQEWVLRQLGVATAYVWAHRRGGSTMDVAGLGPGTGAARVLSPTVMTAIDDYIESVRPGNVRDFLVLTTVPVAQDVRATIDIDDNGYKWDWNDGGIGYTITAFDAVAKTITVPTAPAAVIAGLRLQVNGEEARVTNRLGNVLTLTFDTDHDGNAVAWFTFTVATGVDTIRASGDLVRPVKFAIIDLFNTLGPARSTWSETSWTDQLKLSKLFAAITDVAGVDDATVINPVGNVSPPADTFGASVSFLVPGKIEVLKP
jgi:uncharacterized phage protein gp47/JayE